MERQSNQVLPVLSLGAAQQKARAPRGLSPPAAYPLKDPRAVCELGEVPECPQGGASDVHQVHADLDLAPVLSGPWGHSAKGTGHTVASCRLPGDCGPLRVFRVDCLLLKEPLGVCELVGAGSRGRQGAASGIHQAGTDSDLAVWGRAQHSHSAGCPSSPGPEDT